MKTTDTRAYVNQLLVGLLVTIGFGGSIGVGTVWMRHRVSVLADTNASLTKQLTEVERRILDVNARVEEAMGLDVLRTKNESMRLGLKEMSPAQIHLVTTDPIRQLVARSNQRAAERAAANAEFRIELPALRPGVDATTEPLQSAALMSPTSDPTSFGVRFAQSNLP